MSHDPANDEGQLREELVAYLDGELDAEQSRRIEERAAVEPGARRMLEELDRTWHMLDELDSPATSEDFTCTTLEMVALAAAEDAQKAKAERPRRRLRARSLGRRRAGRRGGGRLPDRHQPDPRPERPIAAGSADPGELRSVPRDRQHRFSPCLEQRKTVHGGRRRWTLEIRAKQSVRLAEEISGFLAIAAALAASLGAVETLSQRRRQVEEMTAEQREELFRNEQQFRALSPQDQQRIRDLHEQIESAPDREKLRATMNRYCKWFETQPPFRRAKLLDKKKTPEERIARVKEFLNRPGPTKDIHLDDRNRRVLAAWLDRYTTEHGARFMESMTRGPTGANRPASARPATSGPAGDVSCGAGRWAVPNGQMPIAEHEMARLLAGLSPDLRAKLEAKKPAERDRIIADWLRETASQELDEQLADFFRER